MKYRLVDRILEWQPRMSIHGIKVVSLEEYSLKECFGEPPRLPESLVLGSVVQLGQWLMVLSSDFHQTAVLSGVKQVCFDAVPAPGERMAIDIRVHDYGEDCMTFDAAGRIGKGHCLTVTGCRLAALPLATCCDPSDLRVLFGEIYQPRGREP